MIATVTKRTELGPLAALPTARHARVERGNRFTLGSTRSCAWIAFVEAHHAAVPPQNLVERRIVDVSALGASSPTPMIDLLYALLATARSSMKSQRELALENLALRQQLAVLKRRTKRPKLTNADRAMWVALYRPVVRLAERSDPREARDRDQLAS
jgi:hypothetical protein